MKNAFFSLILSFCLGFSPLCFAAETPLADIEGKIIKISIVNDNQYKLTIRADKKKKSYDVTPGTAIVRTLTAKEVKVGQKLFTGEGSSFDPLSKFKIPSPPKLPEIPKRPELAKIPDPPQLPTPPGAPDQADAPPQGAQPGGGEEGGKKAEDPKEEKPKDGVLDQPPLLSAPNEDDIKAAEYQKKIKTVTKVEKGKKKISLELKSTEGATETAEFPETLTLFEALEASQLQPKMKIKFKLNSEDDKRIESLTVLS